jgi:xanthine dehydrogenase YagR molybdenum-binding subunit
VNADIGDIDVGLIDWPDPLASATGLKGLVGQAAARAANPRRNISCEGVLVVAR